MKYSFHSESVMKTVVKVYLSSLSEISYGVNHSNETPSIALLHGTISFSLFYNIKFGIFLEF